MKTPAEAARTLRACFLCGDTRIAAVGFVVPVNDDVFAALMRLREQPLADDEAPTVWFALCAYHARRQDSAARVESQILAAAEMVAVH